MKEKLLAKLIIYFAVVPVFLALALGYGVGVKVHKLKEVTK
jgi:hypothetical protein